jgi:isopropylmalate/homocitrate/citramalate synthase
MSSEDEVRQRVFSSEQVGRLRSALDGFRQGPGYAPGRWKVSDANRRPDVVGDLPASVAVRDLTLRVSEQMSDVSLSREARFRLLAAIVRTGVASVEISGFGRGHTVDEMREEVELVKSIDPACEVLYTGAGTATHMEMAAESGVDAVRVLSGTFLGEALPAYSGAVYHRAWQGRGWDDLRFPRSAAEVTERAQRLVALGADLGVKVGGSVLLLSYADDDDVAGYCRGVREAGAYDVQIGDHSSGTAPEAFAHFVRVARQAAPGLRVAVHTHDMFGLATAAAVACAVAGADIVEASVSGFTEGPAQGCLQHIVGSLEMLYGISTGVDLAQLTPLAQLTEELLGVRRSPDFGLTGPAVFDFGNDGDEYAQEHKVDPLIHMSVVPEVVGNVGRRRIGLTSGPYTLWDKLDELGIEVGRSRIEAVLDACKHEVRNLGRGLEDDEIEKIATATLAGPGGPLHDGR